MITIPVVDLVSILNINKTGPMIPAGALVVMKLKTLYDVEVNYVSRWGHVTYSFMELTFKDPREETLFRLKYSEYL